MDSHLSIPKRKNRSMSHQMTKTLMIATVAKEDVVNSLKDLTPTFQLKFSQDLAVRLSSSPREQVPKGETWQSSEIMKVDCRQCTSHPEQNKSNQHLDREQMTSSRQGCLAKTPTRTLISVA